MEGIYLKRIKEKHPKFTRRKLKEMMNFDCILSAKEAVELGLADKILGE
jgi:ATP-dependent protease ClpP protease subunit